MDNFYNSTVHSNLKLLKRTVSLNTINSFNTSILRKENFGPENVPNGYRKIYVRRKSANLELKLHALTNFNLAKTLFNCHNGYNMRDYALIGSAMITRQPCLIQTSAERLISDLEETKKILHSIKNCDKMGNYSCQSYQNVESEWQVSYNNQISTIKKEHFKTGSNWHYSKRLKSPHFVKLLRKNIMTIVTIWLPIFSKNADQPAALLINQSGSQWVPTMSFKSHNSVKFINCEYINCCYLQGLGKCITLFTCLIRFGFKSGNHCGDLSLPSYLEHTCLIFIFKTLKGFRDSICQQNVLSKYCLHRLFLIMNCSFIKFPMTLHSWLRGSVFGY
ncbi:hypothetical protein EGR_03717 [Echinococcus granulosus]|uniref:Uncharacterized protein n=1 Tax=Echinococcus granulosus TaxID=6210 RepID=W6UST0_ECHGR|nr:hypothetical protein EGR_03717 [Echinococcus granulosus]EUB61427.1 hypothetical protein EGR_03717 [Echinococcus granulosus]